MSTRSHKFGRQGGQDDEDEYGSGFSYGGSYAYGGASSTYPDEDDDDEGDYEEDEDEDEGLY